MGARTPPPRSFVMPQNSTGSMSAKVCIGLSHPVLHPFPEHNLGFVLAIAVDLEVALPRQNVPRPTQPITLDGCTSPACTSLRENICKDHTMRNRCCCFHRYLATLAILPTRGYEKGVLVIPVRAGQRGAKEACLG